MHIGAAAAAAAAAAAEQEEEEHVCGGNDQLLETWCCCWSKNDGADVVGWRGEEIRLLLVKSEMLIQKKRPVGVGGRVLK